MCVCVRSGERRLETSKKSNPTAATSGTAPDQAMKTHTHNINPNTHTHTEYINPNTHTHTEDINPNTQNMRLKLIYFSLF